MKFKNLLLFSFLLIALSAYGINITTDHYGFSNGAIRNFRQGSWSLSTHDLTEGTGKTWSFNLPNVGYVNNTYQTVSGISSFPGANISCYYDQSVNGYTGSGNIYYQDNGTDILTVGYTGAPNTVWNPAIPSGLPHYFGKTWQGNHAYTYGSYTINAKVISQGILTTHLGSFSALCVRYSYSTTNLSYQCYQWETEEYGITAYTNTLNGGMAYVLYQAEANVMNNDYTIAPSTISFDLYPNPTSKSATLVYSSKEDNPLTISIYNLRGQLLYQDRIPASDKSHTIMLDTAIMNLGNGIYLVKLKQDGATATRRLLVKG